MSPVERSSGGGGGGGGGVTSLDTITGAVTLVAGSNVTITDNSPVAGDITIAAASGGAMVNLFDSTLGADAATIDTGAGGVSTAYAHLFILIYGRTDANADAASFLFNNDTGPNYAMNYWKMGLGATGVEESATGQTALAFICSLTGTTSAATFGVAKLWIPNYSTTSGGKSIMVDSFAPGALGGSPSNWGGKFGGGYWSGTAAISRVACKPQVGTVFRTGTRLTIYGAQ